MQMFGEIPDFLVAWIEKQQTFWVASAPLSADGLVNISPKGVAGTFHVANPHQVWYEDLSGSGVETISHIRENGRVTILLNAFEGPPRIARLYGRGSVFEFGSPEYNSLLPEGKRHPGSRAVIFLDVFKVATTCGYSVPLYEYKGHRTQLLDWAAKKEAIDRMAELTPTQYQPKPEGHEVFSAADSSLPPMPSTGMKRWWQERNLKSLDDMPALDSAHVSHQVFKSQPVPKKSIYEITGNVNAVQHTAVEVSSKGNMTLFSLLFRDGALCEPRSLLPFFFGVFITLLCGRLSSIAARALLPA